METVEVGIRKERKGKKRFTITAETQRATRGSTEEKQSQILNLKSQIYLLALLNLCAPSLVSSLVCGGESYLSARSI
jgi:hypothetical protein